MGEWPKGGNALAPVPRFAQPPPSDRPATMKVALIYIDIDTKIDNGMPHIGLGQLRGWMEMNGIETKLFHVINQTELKRLPDAVLAFQPGLIGFSSITNMHPFSISTTSSLKTRCDTPIIFGETHPALSPCRSSPLYT